jgi:5-methylthioadenosine/S-adenosylhomocysteine deaminase
VAANRLLLRNGDVVDVERGRPPAVRSRLDVLVDGGHIVAVAPDLPATGAEVVDVSGRLVLPGFVDTHRHTWQTPLRGAAVDADLAGYLERVQGRLAPLLEPEDVYDATLAGALECLHAGITTLQDYSDVQHTPEHTDAAVAALRAAGVRAVFAYGRPVFDRARGYPVFDTSTGQPGELRRLRTQHFSSGGGASGGSSSSGGSGGSDGELVTLALAAELGLRVMCHAGRGPVAERPVDTLRTRGLLSPDVTYVHGNSLPDDELRLIAESGGAVSVAPAVEAQMGHGAPMVGRLRAAGVTTGLGVDVVTAVAGDMFSLMRAAVLSGRFGEGPPPTAGDALRLGTLGGAAALGLDGRIGSLRPGKAADVVVLRTDGPNLIGGSHDPVGTVVAAAHPGDVETVLVAGRVVKRDFQLTHPGAGRAADAARGAAERLARRAAALPAPSPAGA